MSDVNTHHFPHGDILVVDDNKSDLKLLSSILREAGYKVRPASDGELALRSVRARPPGLILLDIEMPGLDGYEVCRRLKDAKDTRDVPLIFISARTSPLDKVKAFDCGGVDYVSKPFDPDEVLARVATHLALRKAQKDIEEKNLQLQQEIAERVRAEETLKERTVQLQAANKELEAFAYSVSHDLRAPLRAIHGFAEIIAHRHRESLNEEGQHYFDNIAQAGGQMDRLIDDLLIYSRLGRRAVRHQLAPLGDLLAQVIETLADRVAETGAHLNIPDDLPVITGDPMLLNRILTNLLDNALTYHRPGVPLRVEVSCQAEADRIILRVTDNGIGIAPEFHEKIFSIFQRLHSQDEYPGAGIGLAMVKKSAELLGGRVWVESVVGEGSTFSVELPQTWSVKRET